MGDKIAIFQAGRLEQFDSPDNVLAHPAQPFIADFVGADRTIKRLGLIRVGDAMRTDMPAAGLDSDLAKAQASLRETGAAALVITTPEGKPHGFITAASTASGGSTCAHGCSPIAGRVSVTADLREAVSKMFENDVEWLACVDETGRYVGTLDQRRITHLLGQTYAGGARA